MDRDEKQHVWQSIGNAEQASAFVEKLISVAEPGVVFGEPVSKGDYTVITASEISVGGGFGFGSGGMMTAGRGPAEATAEEGAAPSFGGGGGGGGGAMGRPVAVITISTSGVRVDPVIDATKVALAFLAFVGSVVVLVARLSKKR